VDQCRSLSTFATGEICMKIKLRHKDIIAEICIGERSLRSVETDLEALRHQCGQSADILTSTQAFLVATSRSNTFPVAVLMRRGTALYGAVLLHGHKKYGMPTGMFRAGHRCGRGATIAVVSERPVVAEIAAQVLLRSLLAHAVAIRLLRPDMVVSLGDEVRAREINSRWHLHDIYSSISLEDGMEGLMSRLSFNMRRNLRRYKRRAEKDLACVFIPQLSPAQSRQAAEALNASSLFPLPAANARRYEAGLRDTPGSFAMGLHDGAGNWLSYLAGWRHADTIYVEWQLNLRDQDAASLSTVMRAYCLEHEINRGTRQIIFVGGAAAPAWKRACVPEVCSELHVVRKGFVSLLVRVVSQRLRPRGQIADIYRQAARATLPMEALCP
jgi:hypothetical protein